MIDDFGQVYVIDWGLAIKWNDSDEEKRYVQGNTPAYCPPEIFPPNGCHSDFLPATPAADVYMLGGILYQIVVSSRKTFNEEFSEASKYVISQWKTYNRFPEIPDASEEMRGVLTKALAYKPENRYQNAEEFVDALKKYQRNYQRERRFNENKEKFNQWKKEDVLAKLNDSKSVQSDTTDLEDAESLRKSENSQKYETAKITNGLTASVNEFTSIREEMDKDGVLKQKEAIDKSLFFNVLREELQARAFLVDRSINEQDYGQAEATLVAQREVVAEYQNFEQASEFCQQTLTELQEQRKRIANGKIERKLNRNRKDVQVIPGIFPGNQTETQQGFAVKLSQSGRFDGESYGIGKSWASIIDSQTAEEQMNTLLRVGSIISCVHRESKIVHGDLKPENVMFHHSDEPCVVTWDFAINLEDDEEKRVILGGTPAYWAPEVCPPEGFSGSQKPVTPATDVYMLGGILYQIIAPSHKTFNEAMEEVSNFERSMWKNRNKFPEIPDVSEEIYDILAKALAYKPEDRYQDAGEFVDALKKYRTAEQTPEFLEQIETELQIQRRRIEKEFWAGKRNKFLMLSVVIFLILILTSSFSAYEAGKRINETEIQTLKAENQVLLKQNALLKNDLAPETKDEEL